MTYGPVKHTANECVEAILEAIKDRLFKTDAFSNPSLAYTGLELSATLDITLHSRGVTERKVKVEQAVGEKDGEKSKNFRLKVKAAAGKKLTVEPGNHVRDREGVEV